MFQGLQGASGQSSAGRRERLVQGSPPHANPCMRAVSPRIAFPIAMRPGPNQHHQAVCCYPQCLSRGASGARAQPLTAGCGCVALAPRPPRPPLPRPPLPSSPRPPCAAIFCAGAFKQTEHTEQTESNHSIPPLSRHSPPHHTPSPSVPSPSTRRLHRWVSMGSLSRLTDWRCYEDAEDVHAHVFIPTLTTWPPNHCAGRIRVRLQ